MTRLTKRTDGAVCSRDVFFLKLRNWVDIYNNSILEGKELSLIKNRCGGGKGDMQPENEL